MGERKLSEGHGFIEGVRICLGGQRGFSGSEWSKGLMKEY